jgi:ATP-binding cassette subfamily F protein 3
LRAWTWKGNYSQFVKQKAESEAALGDLIKNTEKKIQSTMGALAQMKRANKYDKSISAKHKMIERMQQEVKALRARVPKQRKSLIMTLDAVDKASMDVLELTDACMTFEGLKKPILDNQDLEVRKGDRIGIVGGNGQGKTTLVKSIAQRLPLMTGTRKAPKAIRIGYFSQDQLDELSEGDSVLNHVMRALPKDTPESKIRAMAASMGFAYEKVGTNVEKLSGGEKVRLLLGLMSIEKPHVLILDEPTSHLDIDSREALIYALNDFPGAVLLITHDVYLAEATADRLWLVNNGRAKRYDGDLKDYRKLVMAADRS